MEQGKKCSSFWQLKSFLPIEVKSPWAKLYSHGENWQPQQLGDTTFWWFFSVRGLS